jgi:cytochrome P450
MDPMVSILLFVGFMIMASKLLSNTKKKQNLPPSPPSLPVVGHLHLFRNKHLHHALAEISHRHGPVLLLKFGSRPVLVVSSSSAAEECFTTHDAAFANRPTLLFGKYFAFNYTSISWVPNGPLFRELRRLSFSEVFSTQSVNNYTSIREGEVKFLIQRLHNDQQPEKGGFRKVELRSTLFGFSFNVVMLMVNGRRYNDDATTKDFREIVPEVLRLSGEINIRDYFPFLRLFGPLKMERETKAMSEKVNVMLNGLIEEHKARRKNNVSGEQDRKTLIDVMLKLQEENPLQYDNDAIMGQILSMIVAGTDPNTVTTEWAMALLLNHPKAMDKVVAEIKEKVGTNKLVNESDLPKLPYLQAVISETLRLKPVSPLLLPHESSSDTTIGGYEVPRGTMLFVNVWDIQRDDRVWEEAEKFKPERFLHKQTDGETEKTSFKLFPFGFGRRKCPGEVLSQRVVGLTLAALIQCFEWERVGDKEVDISEAFGLTMPKVYPLEAMYRTRKDMVPLLA